MLRIEKKLGGKKRDGTRRRQIYKFFVKKMKEEIKKMVIQGMSDEEIKEHFVQKYGIEILANPPKKGFDTLVWLAPLFYGFFGIVFLYRYIFS